MKAISVAGFGLPAKLVEMEEPRIGKEEVLIGVKAVALGRGEQNYIKGVVSVGGTEATEERARGFIFPHVPGFKGAGVVEKTGPDVSSLRPGDRVVINGVVNCRVCPECMSGLDNFCRHLYLLGLESGHHGSLAEKVKAPYWGVYKIPTSLSFSEALLLSDMSLMVHTFEHIYARVGSSMLIFGIGLVGSVTIQVARAFGITDVICVDTREHALEYAQKIGAKYTINSEKRSVLEFVKEKTQETGADYAIDFVGEGKVIEQCVSCVRRRGTAVLIANPKSVSVKFADYCKDMINREITVQAIFSKTQRDFQRTVRLVEDGLIDTSVFRFERFSISNFQKAAERVLDLSHTNRIVIDPSE